MDNWLLRHGDSLQFALYGILLIVLGSAEAGWPHRHGERRRRYRWPTNFALTAINIAVLPFLPVSFLSAAIWAQRHGYGLLNWYDWPLIVAVPANVGARAFISFFTHYLNHMVPWLWRVHRVHHLDTELDISTTVRFHPLEFVVGLLIGVPIVVALGLSPWLLIGYEVLDTVVNLWSHSNTRVPAPLERWLRLVIVTPDLHRVHHSAWKPETNSNYGAVFPIWDIVFGTYRSSTRLPTSTMPLGLETERDEQSQQLARLLMLRGAKSDQRGVSLRKTPTAAPRPGGGDAV